MIAGCRGGKQSSNESDIYVTVDVKANYSKKELILQDFMDVEYIVLETNDEFITQGVVLDVGKETMLIRNNAQDGEMFIFDKKGKGIRKINRRGGGGEEYKIILGSVLDEDNNEIFVNDIITMKVMVYDLFGNFKRSFQHNEGDRYDNIYNFDSENLICNVVDSKTPEKSFIIISKQDGSIVSKIHIPFKQKKSTEFVNSGNLVSFYFYYPILPFQDSWILSESSSDTVFRLLPDYSMVPFIIRTPSIQSMSPEVFLFPKIITDRYCFMDRIKMENNFTKTDLVYDRQERTIYEYTLQNDDYVNKKLVNLSVWETNNDRIAFWQKIEADELIKSYKRNELKGELKKIAEELDEESNPVIMLIKHRT